MEVQVEKEVEDEKLLLVTGQRKTDKTESSSVKQLAHALNKTLAKHGQAKLKCVGAAAVNRAVKAMIVAELNEQSEDDTISYICRPQFSTASFDGGRVEKTAIIFVVSRLKGSSSSSSSSS